MYEALKIDAGAVPHSRIVDAGLQAVVLLYFVISPLALLMMGWQYEDTGGNAMQKFHPASLLTVAVFLVAVSINGNPLSRFLRVMSGHPLLWLYLAGIGFMIWYAAVVVRLPFTIFLETFLVSYLLFFLLRDMPPSLGRRLAILIHVLFLANALLGIAESALSFRITPIVVNGELLEDEARASALLGHPLANAIIVGTYLLTLAVGGGRDLPAWLRPLCFLVNAASMAAFGGRAATAILIVALILLAFFRLFAVARGATFDTRGVLAGLIVVPVVALLAVGLNELGFFDAFLSRVQDDDGSADTRIVMFELFRHQNWHDLLFMPDQGVMATWARLYGTDYGIESFVVSYMLTYGIVATVLFLPTLMAFCVEVVRSAQSGASGVYAYFFAVALTSLSLSAKSPVFTMVTLLIMVLLRRDRTAEDDAGSGVEAGRQVASSRSPLLVTR